MVIRPRNRFAAALDLPHSIPQSGGLRPMLTLIQSLAFVPPRSGATKGGALHGDRHLSIQARAGKRASRKEALRSGVRQTSKAWGTLARRTPGRHKQHTRLGMTAPRQEFSRSRIYLVVSTAVGIMSSSDAPNVGVCTYDSLPGARVPSQK